MAAEKMDVDKAVTNGSITNGDNKDNNKEKTKAKAKTNANLSKEGIAKKKKKYGSLFGAGDPLRSHANVQSELRPMAHLLYNLGLGLVRETVYGEIIKNKKDCVDLTAKEQSHRDKMQKSHVSLVEKNTIFPKPQKSSEKNIKAYKDEYITNSNKAVSICSLCEKKFQGSNKNYDFAIHMIQIHKRKPRKHHESLKYRCNLCCYESSVRKTFTRHTKRCQAKFTLKINLRQNPSDYEMPIPSQHKSFNINKGINNTSPSVKSINRNPRPASGRDRLQINNSQQQQQQQNQLQRQQTPGKIQGGQSMLKNPTAGQIISVQGKLYTIFFRNGQRLLAPIRNQMPTKVMSESTLKRDQTKRIIEDILNMRCLWCPVDPEYTNVQKKAAAFQFIAKKNSLTVNEIQTRFRSVKDKYTRERKKYEESKKKVSAGASAGEAEDVPEPTWYLWDEMSQISVGTLKGRSFSNLPTLTDISIPKISPSVNGEMTDKHSKKAKAKKEESKRDEIKVTIKEEEKTLDFHMILQLILSIEKIERVDRKRAYNLRMKLMQINMEAMKILRELNINLYM